MNESIIPTIYKVACQHYHCSDGDDKQYPDCNLKENRSVCPALTLIVLYEEIQEAKLATEDKDNIKNIMKNIEERKDFIRSLAKEVQDD